ncbi:MAG: hypothetical protein CMA27_04600, partial [Euryarchaeota archaeon]|nr:hypothetical protein [Euryarchaeota archaeon]
MFSEELEPLENPEFAPSAPFDILMYGNSYTSANNLASLVQDGMVSGGVATTVDSLTGGGMTLDGHSQNAQSSGHSWNTTLNDGTAWDYVVLQDQSQIPGLYRNTAYWQDSLAGAQVLDGFAEDVGAESILMMTWGRRNGDSNNQVLYPDFLSMQERLEDGYIDYRDNLSTPNRDVWIAPVGLAFKHIYENVQASGVTPENSGNLFYDLYSSDGSHPSLSGSYLASCVLYATITGNSPVGLTDSTSLSASIKSELQEAAAATVFNETNHLTYSWQITSQNNTGNAYSSIPSLQNQTRYAYTFNLQINDGDSDAPGAFGIEYDDGKFITVFKDTFILESGVYESPSVSLWSVPPQGFGSFIELQDMNEDLEIPLSTNFTNFDTCKPHVYNFNIYVYCVKYEDGQGFDLLEFDNNNSILIKNGQDILIHWNYTGHFQNAWIPQASGSLNWGGNIDYLASADYFMKVHFLDDEIFLMMEGASTSTISFPNGTLNCKSGITGYCNFIAKLNLNGTLIDYLSFSKNIPSSNPNYAQCNFERFEIANKSSIQLKFNNDDCVIYDSNGNTIPYSIQFNQGIYFGFDLQLNLIRAIEEKQCGNSGLEIKAIQILPEKTYYVMRGGDENCQTGYEIWHNENFSSSMEGYNNIVTLGSQFSNGSQEWTYSW